MRLVRVFFRKVGRGMYISHLDLNKAMQRSVKRSGVPVWYTMGFNPHMYMTFALPLSLGFEGLRESMDIRVLEDYTNEQVKTMLGAALPPCIEMVSVAEPVMDAREIAWADYQVTLELWDADLQKTMQAFAEFAAKEGIVVEKKGKRGVQMLDISAMFTARDLVAGENEFTVMLRVAAGSQLNINPSLILGAFAQDAGVEILGSRVVRTDIFTEKLVSFH